MIIFELTEPEDMPQIDEWISADPDHKGKSNAAWWLGGSIVNVCAEDAKGPVMYLRLDKEEDYARVHIQFGPPDQVSKMRIAAAFMDGLPRMADTVKALGCKGLIFESTSESLIQFMGKMGFTYYGGQDYVRRA